MRTTIFYGHIVVLSGLVVSVLATGPKIHRFNPAKDNGFFKGNKNQEYDFLAGWGGEMSAHVIRFYGMLKILVEYDRNTLLVKFKDIFYQLPASLLGVSVTSKELWWMNQQ
jgi:hypothetical protein